MTVSVGVGINFVTKTKVNFFLFSCMLVIDFTIS